VAASRAVATDLKQRVDALVRSANENIARAADAMGANLLNNTLWFVVVSVAIVLLATLLSYRFVVRDISLIQPAARHLQHHERRLLGSGTRAAAGAHRPRPAGRRPDESGDQCP
jgi:hypothetical protein